MPQFTKVLLILSFLLGIQFPSLAQKNDYVRPNRNFNAEESGQYIWGQLLKQQTEQILYRIVDKTGEDYAKMLIRLAQIKAGIGEKSDARNDFQRSAQLLLKRVGVYNDTYVLALNSYVAFLIEEKQQDSALMITKKVFDITNRLERKKKPLGLLSIIGAGENSAVLHELTEAAKYEQMALQRFDNAAKKDDFSDFSAATASFAILAWRIHGTDGATISFLQRTCDQLASYIETKGSDMNEYRLKDLELTATQVRNFLLSLTISDPNKELRLLALRSEFLLKSVYELKFNGKTRNKNRPVAAITLSDIKQHLDAKDVFIDFVSFDFMDVLKELEATRMYGAFIVYPGERNPEFIPLFSTEELSRLIYEDGRLRSAAELYNAPGAIDDFNQSNIRLARIIWEPLKSYIGERNKNIYFIADGSLSLLNLGALADNGGYLADQYHLQGLLGINSLPELEKDPPKPLNRFAIIGNLNFGERGTKAAFYSTPNDWIFGEMVFDPLVWSGKEVETIGKLLADHHRQFTPLEGKDADKKSIIRLMGEHFDVLHFSTHGYSFPLTVKIGNTIRQKSTDFDLASDPLRRFGMALSLANDKNAKQSDNNFLTAADVANMDLSSNRLIILSACSTATGDIGVDKGVQGLTYAFRAADAKYLVVSLYPVDDERTSIFMKILYQKLLSPVFNSIPIAFRSAINEFKHLPSESRSTAWTNWVLLR